MRISDWSSDVCSSDLLFLDDLADFSGADFHYSAFRRGQLGAFGRTGCQPFIACAKLLRRVRMLPSISWLPSWTTRPPRMAGSTVVATVRSEEHTSELQSLMRISYAGLCLKKKTKKMTINNIKRECRHHN